jgi:hypothetical protein
VRLIGYCTEGALFLVYEYIENGNLSQHLRSSGTKIYTMVNSIEANKLKKSFVSLILCKAYNGDLSA